MNQPTNQPKTDRRRGPKLDPEKRELVQWWAQRMRKIRKERCT